jgi:hypothetical protein
VPDITWKKVTPGGHAESTSFEPIHQACRTIAQPAL